MCLLFTGLPDRGCGAGTERPIALATQTGQDSTDGHLRSAISAAALRLSRPDPGAVATAGASIKAPKDPIWNGVLIGAALGLVAIVTTAAEAPPSGKATTVVMIAALGGYIDSRLAVTGIVRSGSGGRGRQIALRKSLRF